MVLYYNNDILLNDEQFTPLHQALAENWTIHNLPETPNDVSLLFYFALFLALVFDDIKEKCPDLADEIPDPLDLCSLFYLKTLGYDL